MDKQNFTSPIALNHIEITDPFWKHETELVRTRVIPYQWEALNDRIPEASPSYCMHNFKTAGKITQAKETQPDYIPPVYTTNGFCVWPEDPAAPEDRFYGFVFQDSDFAKWIESVAYSLICHPDPALEQTADEAIDIVCKAQQEDGYLDTFYIINDMSKRFTNLRDHHELYCLGHLIEGAVAYYEATGKEKLLQAACRYTDCVASHLGEADAEKLPGYPGHEIAEMALARLYEVTGEQKYLDLGLYFINERGKRPYYFDREHPPKAGEKENLRYHYHQAHLPVREQEEAVGHAVRAVYLYSGMADYARLTLDDSLKDACRKLWDNIVTEKMYIIGGIGATHIGEAFSFGYDLPNDTAYAETCASIGMVFFARRMLELGADSRYADVMERELYNIVLSGMGLDGTSFFYVNPLEVFPEACRKDERKEHVKASRQKWFGCACCPPNLARLISSIGSYAVTQKPDTVYLHLYMGCRFTQTVNGQEVSFSVQSGFPWKGNVEIQIASETDAPLTLALRIPGWCSGYHISDIEAADIKVENGYLYVTKVWGNEAICLDFPMETQIMTADTRVREDIGKAAVVRGPVVYCLEEADNGKDLHLLKMDGSCRFEEVLQEIGGQTVISLKAQGWRQQKRETGHLYNLYERPKYKQTTLNWIPYYTWANRSEGEMQVWTRI